MPASRPSRTARVIAAVPKRSRITSRAASSARRRRRRTEARAGPRRVVEVRDRDPDQRQARRSINGIAAASRSRAAARTRPSRRSLRQRVRARRPGEVVEAQPEHDRPARRGRPARIRRVTRSTSATRVASTLAGDPAAAERALRPDRARGGGRAAPAADRGCARARGGDARRRARASTTSASSREPRDLADGRDPARRELAAVTGPTPQSRSTGSGCRNSSSPSGGTTSRPSGFATPLATLARNFVRATPTVIGRPTRSRTSRRSRAAISTGVPEIRAHPAHVEERLVDREPLDERRRVVEDLEHRLARLGVRRHARRDDDRVGAQPARLPAAHRGADAERLRLVARREHDPAADDDGPAAQPRVVALLDRRVERVDIGVQDRRLPTRTYVRIERRGSLARAAPEASTHLPRAPRIASSEVSPASDSPVSRRWKKPCLQGFFRSRPVSRILSWMAIHLGRRFPGGSSGVPGPSAGRVSGTCFALHRTGFG